MSRRALLLATAALCAAAASASARESLPEVGEQAAVLKDKGINESSGLALSIADPTVFWTLNDSGGEPCVFAVDRQGRTRAKVRLRDAANFDWEDLSSYRDAQGKGWLYVGDIGDNLRLRPTVQIYRVAEPPLPPLAQGSHETETAAPEIFHLSYPGGPRNAEALLVHPQTGRLYIVSKDDDGHSGVYAAPETLRSDQAMPMVKIADLEFPATPRMGKRPKDACQVTAACFSPDGSRVVIATYTYLHEWRIQEGETLAQTLARPAEVIKPVVLPQLEAICYDSDNHTLWLTSERLPTGLYRITR
jgi:hypothetical protein